MLRAYGSEGARNGYNEVMIDRARRVTELLQRLETWLRAHRPRYLDGLNPPASTAEIEDLELALGAPVPEELRALLTWRNGQGPGFIGAFENSWILLTSERIAAAKRILDADADATGWHTAWVPLLDNDAGDYLCLDQNARVRAFWLGKQEHPVIAESLVDWLNDFVTNVENGNYVEEPERGTFLRRT
jgi:cell wall assembly regulator SMI1